MSLAWSCSSWSSQSLSSPASYSILSKMDRILNDGEENKNSRAEIIFQGFPGLHLVGLDDPHFSWLTLTAWGVSANIQNFLVSEVCTPCETGRWLLKLFTVYIYIAIVLPSNWSDSYGATVLWTLCPLRTFPSQHPLLSYRKQVHHHLSYWCLFTLSPWPALPWPTRTSCGGMRSQQSQQTLSDNENHFFTINPHHQFITTESEWQSRGGGRRNLISFSTSPCLEACLGWESSSCLLFPFNG